LTNLQRNITFIRKEIEGIQIVWFKNSKSFTLFEKPAFDVFRMYSKGVGLEEIIEYCQKKYGNQEENIPQFVAEIIEWINRLNQSKHSEPFSTIEATLGSGLKKDKLESHYLFGEKYLTIQYDNEYLRGLIHPLFFYLETEKNKKSECFLELISSNNLLIVKYNNRIIESFQSTEVIFFKGAILKFLYGFMHDKDYNSWMMTLHASGVTHKNKAVLFSANAGSGKSTLAALLHANGYNLLSDDFVAADKNAYVYPSSAAISVKDGAVNVLSEYYPELLKMPFEKAFNRKEVRFIQNRNQTIKAGSKFKVKAIIFIKFTSKGESFIKEMDKKEAIRVLLKEIWVQPESENVSRFLEWVSRSDFYQMQYSDTDWALKCISKIFEN